MATSTNKAGNRVSKKGSPPIIFILIGIVIIILLIVVGSLIMNNFVDKDEAQDGYYLTQEQVTSIISETCQELKNDITDDILSQISAIIAENNQDETGDEEISEEVSAQLQNYESETTELNEQISNLKANLIILAVVGVVFIFIVIILVVLLIVKSKKVSELEASLKFFSQKNKEMKSPISQKPDVEEVTVTAKEEDVFKVVNPYDSYINVTNNFPKVEIPVAPSEEEIFKEKFVEITSNVSMWIARSDADRKTIRAEIDSSSTPFCFAQVSSVSKNAVDFNLPRDKIIFEKTDDAYNSVYMIAEIKGIFLLYPNPVKWVVTSLPQIAKDGVADEVFKFVNSSDQPVLLKTVGAGVRPYEVVPVELKIDKERNIMYIVNKSGEIKLNM